MRRRQRDLGILERPARLLTFDEAEWLPLVDPDGYDPEDYRSRGANGPYGPPRWTFDASRRQKAWNLWSRARLDWHREHGWPGGLDCVGLQETVRARRMGTADALRQQHGCPLMRSGHSHAKGRR